MEETLPGKTDCIAVVADNSSAIQSCKIASSGQESGRKGFGHNPRVRSRSCKMS